MLRRVTGLSQAPLLFSGKDTPAEVSTALQENSHRGEVEAAAFTPKSDHFVLLASVSVLLNMQSWRKWPTAIN